MINVYGKPQCPQCHWTTKLLTERGIEFTYYDVTTDPALAEYVCGLTDQEHPTLPLVVLPSGVWWLGFKVDKLKGLPAPRTPLPSPSHADRENVAPRGAQPQHEGT